jgi:DNA-binding beta-propeller fold protein YncE
MKNSIRVAMLVLCAWCMAASAAPAILSDLPIKFSTSWGIDPELRRAYVLDDFSKHVSVIDLDTGSLVMSGDAGPNPRELLVDAAHHLLYWLNDDSVVGAYITVFDARANRVVDFIRDVGTRSGLLAADFARNRLFLGNVAADRVDIYDTASKALVRTVHLGAPPRGIDVDRVHGRVYVAATPHTLWSFDEDGADLVPIMVGDDPFTPRVDERSGKVYVLSPHRSLSVVSDAGVKTIALSAVPSEFPAVLSPVYRRLYFANPENTANSVTIVDIDTDTIVRTLQLRPGPWEVAIDENDGNLYVAHGAAEAVSILDARSETVIGTLPVGHYALHVMTGVDRLLVVNHDSVIVATEQDTLAGTQIATEWYHAGFDHYFHSADEVETRVIQDGRFGSDWIRTMKFFRVWSTAAPGRFGVCRFFSASFAPKSSHFYTPYPQECELRNHDPAWQFETAAAYVLALTDASGGCSSNAAPLYRVYNDGQGGAPNHRYTADRSTRDRMTAAGWLAEGNGSDVIFACTPRLRGD